MNNGYTESAAAANVDFRQFVSDNNKKILNNVPLNKVISSSPVTERPRTLSGIAKEPITDDVTRQKVTASSRDNNDDYCHSMKHFDTFIEKMETIMNFYGNEMSFLTKKLNNLNEKLNTLEILQHEIDQVMNRQNTAEQKLQLIQEAIFGSQSINSKLDRLELSMQQLHVQNDEIMEKQRKSIVQTLQTKRKKPNDDNDDLLSDSDEQFRNCEAKIEQLVGFVHNFAELNRLESTDILNRLGNMQSQLIQFFDGKEMIKSNQSNQQSANDATKQDDEDVEETTIQFSNHLNDTVLPNDASVSNSTDVMEKSQPKESTEMPSTLLNLNDDRKLSTSNGKSIRKRKRMTKMVS